MRKRMAFALIMAVLLSGISAASAAPVLLEPVGVDLDFAEATRMDISTLKHYAYSVVPYVEELYFTVDGEVETIQAYLGARVKEGDVLLSLDESALLENESALLTEIAHYEALYDHRNRSAEIDIQIAELEYSAARAAGADDTTLAQKQGSIDVLKLTLRQTREEQAVHLQSLQADLDAVRAKIGHNLLIAPFDGTVVAIDRLYTGWGVQAYDTVIKLADENRLSLSGDFLSESMISGAHDVYALIRGRRFAIASAPIDRDDYFTTIFAGGTIQTRFDFIDAPDGLECGDYAAVIVESGYREQALCIPCNAVYSDSAGKYVYKLVDGNRIRATVKTGRNNGLYIEVTEGLEEGDRVYVKE